MTSAIPAIFDALVALASAETSACVSDGKAVSSDPGDYLMVGVDNPANVEQTAHTTREDLPYAGGQTRHEVGEIFCTAESVNGDSAGAKAARDSVYALLEDFRDAMRLSKDLGITDFACEVTFGSLSQLRQAQDVNGSRATLTFRVAFDAWTS